MSVTIESAGLTDIGRVRKNNEDHFLIAELSKRLRVTQTSLSGPQLSAWHAGVTGHLLVVADGMGGVAGGEVASGLAVETISWYVAKTMPWFYRYQDGREKELEAELRHAVEAVEQTVSDVASQSHFRRMGTTLTLAYILWPRVYVVHAGDSRCYLHRGGKFVRMTKDHTIAQKAVDEGYMTEAQAAESTFAHTLWNCIGGGTEGVSPDLYHATLHPGDELLLCTDGVTRGLSDDAIRDILKRSPTAESATRALIDAANEAGGPDNITAVVARILPVAEPDTTPPDGTAFLPKV
ncbi:MAG: protein phosphatase 2C domain-containing protein [Planctomycetia bacterium]|nr:protein phosphatase 2C domain-containing protein [Planctomycetia bacterium]